MSDMEAFLADQKRQRQRERSRGKDNKGMSGMSAFLLTIFLVVFLVKMVFIFFEPKVEGVTEYWDETKHKNGAITREKRYSFTPPSGGITIKKVNNGKP